MIASIVSQGQVDAASAGASAASLSQTTTPARRSAYHRSASDGARSGRARDDGSEAGAGGAARDTTPGGTEERALCTTEPFVEVGGQSSVSIQPSTASGCRSMSR